MEHMTDDDVWVADGIRRDVDKDIVEMLMDRNRTVTKVDWWELLGTERDMTVWETKEMNIVDRDGVNLNNRANRCAFLSGTGSCGRAETGGWIRVFSLLLW